MPQCQNLSMKQEPRPAKYIIYRSWKLSLPPFPPQEGLEVSLRKAIYYFWFSAPWTRKKHGWFIGCVLFYWSLRFTFCKLPIHHSPNPLSPSQVSLLQTNGGWDERIIIAISPQSWEGGKKKMVYDGNRSHAGFDQMSSPEIISKCLGMLGFS